MKYTRSFFACGLFCMAFFIILALEVPALAEETVSQESAAVSQTQESDPASEASSEEVQSESSSAPEASVPAAASVAPVSSQAELEPESAQPSSVPSQEPRPVESAAASAIVEVRPSSAAVSVEENSSSEEASSEISSEESSSRASSWVKSAASGTVSTDPMQGGTLSDGGGASRLYGMIAWIVIGAAALVSLIVLIFGKRTRGNRMSSGRAYARRRSVGYKRKRLLEDKYYQNLRRKK